MRTEESVTYVRDGRTNQISVDTGGDVQRKQERESSSKYLTQEAHKVRE